jgi:hypothetical protein
MGGIELVSLTVIPAKAGIQLLPACSLRSGDHSQNWIPAFAGMTS